jgi:CheY-like chemotaxis protein
MAAGDSATAGTVIDALRADAVRVIQAADAASVLRLLGSERPPLVVLARRLPDGADALEVCRAIRAAGSAHAREVPVIVVAARQEEAAAGAAAGVTDWLVEPFSAVYARTRARAWLMRARCRWANAPAPAGEERRLAALRRLGILDTAPEERFDRLTRLAAALFDVPVALVSLVDQNRQWLKSRHGLAARESPREVSFCAHAILSPAEIMVVPDTLQDARFADNPAVTGEPRVRFYAGCPLVLSDGSCIGTLCLIDTRPRELGEAAVGLLRDVGGLVRQELSAGAGRPETGS